MSLKPVELQFALHKNGEAGILQHQQQHRPIIDQSQLAAQAAKTTELDRHRSANVEEGKKSHIANDQQKGSNGGEQGGGARQDRGRKEKEPVHAQTPHPYKGKHIDLSL